MQESYFSENDYPVNLVSGCHKNTELLQTFMRRQWRYCFTWNENRISLQLISFFLILLLGIFLTSCSNNDDNPVAPAADEKLFVGTWNLSAIRSVSQQGNVYELPPDEIAADPLTYILKSDGTGIQVYQGSNTDFFWIVQGNKFIINGQGATQEYVYSVNSTTLTFTFKVTDDVTGEIFTITQKFTR